ncbi:NAD(P)H-binding protein [Streptomyces sp. B-S-A8]|uniref:NAD(P)H-binding protein n=1 Tax=Streptomyces solicavernae TaxID=3043614 RepID=A0ABT6RT30_9ACTN|nr:NAD(P)H-binding protein [Streptomyces sp. B-S-A8]MDI3387588.1 NAD(P)H-binding protein [Streptomyces sp. B-S-A8]
MNTQNDGILVTGSTGNLGREVVARLDAYETPLRALVRDPGTARLPDGVAVATGDLSAPGGLEDAVKGCGTVFLIWPFLTTEYAPAVLDVLTRHVRRVVYVSSSGVAEHTRRQSDPINQLHADMEQLIASSGLEWTFLRADTLASNARAWAGQIRSTRTVRGPDIAPTAVVHERDVAEVAALALTGDGHAGARHVLTGPQVLSRADLVRAVGEATGVPARFEPVSVEVARERMLADGRPPALVEALLAAAADRPASGLVTSTVQDLTGAPARTFRSWAEEYAYLFR